MTAMKNPGIVLLTGDPGPGVLHLLLNGADQEFADETPPEFLDQPFPLLQPGQAGRADETVPESQISQTLDNIQKTHVLGALKGAPGAAGAVPEGRRTEQGRPLAVEHLADDLAGAEAGGQFAHRAGGGTDPTGKAAPEVLTPGLGGHLVLKLGIQTLKIHGFGHKELSAFSGQLSAARTRFILLYNHEFHGQLCFLLVIFFKNKYFPLFQERT
jgi:hypothetical protein